MEDMNDTFTSPDPGPAQDSAQNSAPPPLPPHQDLDRLRRSSSDRYIAGVAGGLGRHFAIDPTVIRVLLVVTTLFGGAGLLFYIVCWLFVPADDKAEATVQVASEPLKIVLYAALGIAVLVAVGDAFNGFDLGGPIVVVALLVAIVLVARDRRKRGPVAPTYPAAPAYPAATTYSPTGQPAWQPPTGTALVPPRPRRTGIVWFWPTLALIAIGLGVVGILDNGSADVAAGVYPAVALAITGAMLLIGSFVGRPGGLVLIGLVSAAALAMATVVGSFHLDGRNIEEDPTTASAVRPDYHAHNGRIVLDLTDVVDPQNLAGRSLHLSLNAGEITVIVPRSLNVDVDAALGFAGGIKIPGYDGGGIQDSAQQHLTADPRTGTSPDATALDLEIDVRVGQINVEQR